MKTEEELMENARQARIKQEEEEALKRKMPWYY